MAIRSTFGKKKAQRLGAILSPVNTDFCLYYEHASWEITKKQFDSARKL